MFEICFPASGRLFQLCVWFLSILWKMVYLKIYSIEVTDFLISFHKFFHDFETIRPSANEVKVPGFSAVQLFGNHHGLQLYHLSHRIGRMRSDLDSFCEGLLLRTRAQFSAADAFLSKLEAWPSQSSISRFVESAISLVHIHPANSDPRTLASGWRPDCGTGLSGWHPSLNSTGLFGFSLRWLRSSSAGDVFCFVTHRFKRSCSSRVIPILTGWSAESSWKNIIWMPGSVSISKKSASYRPHGRPGWEESPLIAATPVFTWKIHRPILVDAIMQCSRSDAAVTSHYPSLVAVKKTKALRKASRMATYGWKQQLGCGILFFKANGGKKVKASVVYLLIKAIQMVVHARSKIHSRRAKLTDIQRSHRTLLPRSTCIKLVFR